MPKMRTKKQKVRAQYHYAVPTSNSFSVTPGETPKPTPKNSVESLFFYDPAYITQDIKRTLITSLILLAALMGIFTYWK